MPERPLVGKNNGVEKYPYLLFQPLKQAITYYESDYEMQLLNLAYVSILKTGNHLLRAYQDLKQWHVFNGVSILKTGNHLLRANAVAKRHGIEITGMFQSLKQAITYCELCVMLREQVPVGFNP